MTPFATRIVCGAYYIDRRGHEHRCERIPFHYGDHR